MPKGPIRPRAGFTPLLRLLGLIAFAILIVVLLLLWVQSCQEDKKRDAYRNYMTSMKAVGDDSAARRPRAQRRAHDARGSSPPSCRSSSGTSSSSRSSRRRTRAQARSARAAARVARPRGRVARVPRQRPRRSRRGVPAHAGVEGRGRGRRAARLAGGAARRERRRLGRPLQGAAGSCVLKTENISGVVVPDSNFVQTPDLASTRSMVPIWERINGSAASGSTRDAERPPRHEHRVGEGAFQAGRRCRRRRRTPSRRRPTSASRSRSRTAATARK